MENFHFVTGISIKLETESHFQLILGSIVFFWSLDGQTLDKLSCDSERKFQVNYG